MAPKLFRSLGVIVFSALAAFGCGDTGSEAAPETLARSGSTLPTEPLADDPVIGLAVQNLERTFFTGLEAGARGEAEALGAELLVADAGDDADKQLADVIELIDQGVHGLVLSPVNSEAAEEIASLAAERGVPLLAVANQIGTVDEYGPQFVFPGTVALVTNDDVDMGRKAATLAAERIGDGSAAIAVIGGKEGTANSVMRRDGFRSELESLAIDFIIVGSEPGDWTAEGGAAACREFATNPLLDMVFSMSDAMTEGCVEVLAELEVDVDVVSIGGNQAGVDLLQDGAIVGTVCQKPGTMGALAVSTMVDALVTADFEQGLRFYETPVVTAGNQRADCLPQW